MAIGGNTLTNLAATEQMFSRTGVRARFAGLHNNLTFFIMKKRFRSEQMFSQNSEQMFYGATAATVNIITLPSL